MAELEDFFAKRDKKKKSKGKKFESVDIDDVAKVLDAKAKERKKLEVYQPPENSDQPINDHGAKEDEDWKEIVDDKPDFSGLKIQEFSLPDDDEANGKDDGQGDADREYEGPWKTKKIQKPVPEAPREEPSKEQPIAELLEEPKSLTNVDETKVDESSEPQSTEGSQSGGDAPETPVSDATPKYMTPAQKKRAEEAAKAKEQSLKAPPPKPASTPSAGALGGAGKYIPPSQRAGATPSSTSSYNKPRKTTAAPNIDSEEYFPSLGGNRS